MDGLVIGRVVYYVFSEDSAAEVNRRRTNGPSIAERLAKPMPEWPVGAQAHIGPEVYPGDLAPAMVVAVNDDGTVNLKVMLNGSDEYWATVVSYSESKARGTWHWMFAGQDWRYEPKTVASTDSRSALQMHPVQAEADYAPVTDATVTNQAGTD